MTILKPKPKRKREWVKQKRKNVECDPLTKNMLQAAMTMIASIVALIGLIITAPLAGKYYGSGNEYALMILLYLCFLYWLIWRS